MDLRQEAERGLAEWKEKRGARPLPSGSYVIMMDSTFYNDIRVALAGGDRLPNESLTDYVKRRYPRRGL